MYRLPLCVIVYTSYKVFKMVQFFLAHSVHQYWQFTYKAENNDYNLVKMLLGYHNEPISEERRKNIVPGLRLVALGSWQFVGMILSGKYLVVEGMSLWNFFNITVWSCHLSIYVISRNGNTCLTPLDVHPELLFFYHFKRRTVHNMSLKYGFNNSAASMKCAVLTTLHLSLPCD